MSDNKERTAGYARAFRQIADTLSELPPDQQHTLREQLSGYGHDLKHTLGLVTSAASLLERDAEVAAAHGEMLEIIQEAVDGLDAYFELLIQNLSNQLAHKD